MLVARAFALALPLALAACGGRPAPVATGPTGPAAAAAPDSAPPPDAPETAAATAELTEALTYPFDPFASQRLTRALGGALPKGAVARYGHRLVPNSLDSVAASADGKRWAACASGFEVILWDAATGLPDRTLTTLKESCHALAFTADGKRLVALGYDSLSYIDVATGATSTVSSSGHNGWSMALGRRGEVVVAGCTKYGTDAVRIYEGDSVADSLSGFPEDLGEVCSHAVAVSPDGKLIAAGSREETLVFRGDKLVGRIWSHWPHAIAFGPDGTLFVANGGAINAYDPSTLEAIASYGYLGNSYFTHSIAVTADGAILYTLSGLGIKAFDVASRRELWSRDLAIDESLAVTPDGDVIAAGNAPNQILRIGRDGAVRAPYDLATHDTGVDGIEILDDGRVLTVGGDVRMWRADGTPLTTFAQRPGRGTTHARMRPGGREAVSVAGGCTLHAWDPAASTIRAAIALGEAGRCTPTGIALTPDGETAVIGDTNGEVHVVALAGPRLTATIAVGGAPRTRPVLDADGKTAWIALEAELIAIDVANAAITSRHPIDRKYPWQLAAAGDGLVYAVDNEVIALARDGKQRWSLALTDDEWGARALLELPGRQLAVGVRGGVVVLDARTGKRKSKHLTGAPSDVVSALAISPDGKRLLAGFAGEVLGWAL